MDLNPGKDLPLAVRAFVAICQSVGMKEDERLIDQVKLLYRMGG